MSDTPDTTTDDAEADDEGPDETEDEDSEDVVDTDTESDVVLDLKDENADLKAMLAHYAPDVDIDSARENNISRSGKFLPAPEGDKPKGAKGNRRAPKTPSGKAIPPDFTKMSDKDFDQALFDMANSG